MISIDTGILFHAFNADSPRNERAFAWLTALGASDKVAISEFALAELYRLVRNPVTAGTGALSPAAAVQLIHSYRSHPRWMIVGFSQDSRRLHDRMWSHARKADFAYRRLFDVRTALILIEHGVREFATTNLKDFEGLGFTRVWNPLD